MKKSIVKMLLISCLILSGYTAYTQEIGKDEMTFLIKLTLFEESSGTKKYIADYKALNDFMTLEFPMTNLKQRGFNDYIFISISPKFNNPKNTSFKEGPFLMDNCKEYIVGMHKRGRIIYKLQGFAHNDFPFFLSSIKTLGYPDTDSLSRFIKNYFVENLDLECLFRAAKDNNFNRINYPCLIDCAGID